MVSRVYVIGMGMGNPGTLTLRAWEALAQSDLIIGSKRLLDALAQSDSTIGPKRLLDAPVEAPDVTRRDFRPRYVALVAADAIARELEQAPEHVASVVVSGDVGFYSGATQLYARLEGLTAEVETIPGISSLTYLCARLKTTWQDVKVVSAHGRAHDACGAVQANARTFVLVGGATRAEDICAHLVERGLGYVRVSVGERLSYPDERIATGSASELARETFDQLAVMLVENDRPIARQFAAPHLSDDAFVRGNVPMTKEEVRELAICKLRIGRDSTVWDVGAGTGSVSVEAARAACEGRVFAVEKSDAALALLRKNRDAFGLVNLHVVAGMAPQALGGLPRPDCVFVGGSSGELEAILRAALLANPCARICVAAITLETLSLAVACVRELDLADVEIVQVSVAKARAVGEYHLMQAQNPVFLVSANGTVAQ